MDTLLARDKGTTDTRSAFFGVGPPDQQAHAVSTRLPFQAAEYTDTKHVACMHATLSMLHVYANAYIAVRPVHA